MGEEGFECERTRVDRKVQSGARRTVPWKVAIQVHRYHNKQSCGDSPSGPSLELEKTSWSWAEAARGPAAVWIRPGSRRYGCWSQTSSTCGCRSQIRFPTRQSHGTKFNQEKPFIRASAIRKSELMLLVRLAQSEPPRAVNNFTTLTRNWVVMHQGRSTADLSFLHSISSAQREELPHANRRRSRHKLSECFSSR